MSALLRIALTISPTHANTHIPTHANTHIPTHANTYIPTQANTHIPTHANTHIPTHAVPPDMVTAVYLTHSHPRALCLDGSPYAFYIHRAPRGANQTKWVFHLQGGGWCTSAESCSGRTHNYLGTSRTDITGYKNSSEFADVDCTNGGCGALMLDDPAINPFAYDWNAVFVRYCDGMAYSGNRTSPDVIEKTGQKIWYRGRENLYGTFDRLAKDFSLGQATDVILHGSSAGGHGIYLHADYMASLIYEANLAANQPNATILAMPDSGYWPDDPRKRFSTIFRMWFSVLGNDTNSLPTSCKYAITNISRCLYPQYFADEIKTRLMPLQSIYDPLQRFSKGSNPQEHGNWIINSMNKTIFSRARNPANGGFIYSCSRHCGGELLKVDGNTAPQAVSKLWSGGQNLFLDHQNFPCNKCCNDVPYPPKFQ